MLLRDCRMRLRSEGGVGFYIWSFGRWMMDGICWSLGGVCLFVWLCGRFLHICTGGKMLFERWVDGGLMLDWYLLS